MGKTSRKKCSGGILCLLNPLDLPGVCFDCPQYGGRRPKPQAPLSMPGHEQFTAWDEPPPEDAVESVCPVCGRLFYAPKNKLYCSHFCKKKAYRQRRAERGGVNRKFQRRRCAVCGRWYKPRTSNQVTCGGPCTEKYFAKKYRRGIAPNHPRDVAPMSGGGIIMETRATCPVQHLKECVELIRRHNPRAEVTPSSLDALAAMLSAKISWYKSLSRPRQAVLLDIAITYGVHGLCSMERLLLAMRSCKWEQARQFLLNSRYASMAGRGAVENARQLVDNAWTVIPEHIPGMDDDDDDDEGLDDADGEYRFF